jgi:hypothetical protein
MAEKKPKPKPKQKPKLSQKQRFIEAARAAETDESGEPFERALKSLLPVMATAEGPPKSQRMRRPKQE